MKNFVIGVFVFGLTSLGFSQDINGEDKIVQLEGVVVTNVNLNYLEKFLDKTLSDNVVSLEMEASVFNVKEVAEFDGRKESYQVKFKATKEYIIADYDRDGKILKTKERYQDINLPKDLIKEVLRQYPNSNFLKVVYTVDYDDQNTPEKIYKIQILNDGKKKNLAINPDRNLSNALTMRFENLK